MKIKGRRRLETTYTVGAHPDLQKAFEEYERMCWWLAVKVAKIFGGVPGDYIGSIVIKLNLALSHYNQNVGVKFSTYLCHLAISFVAQSFVAFESESQCLHASENKALENVEVTNKNFAFHEAEFRLYRIPDHDDDWCRSLLNDNFESYDDAWTFLTGGLQPRQKLIIEARYRDGRDLRDIGRELNISGERVRQIVQQAMESIKKKVSKLEDFAALFKEQERMDECGLLKKKHYNRVG